MSNRYLERGVSAIKEDVHNAIKNEKKGLFENGFFSDNSLLIVLNF